MWKISTQLSHLKILIFENFANHGGEFEHYVVNVQQRNENRQYLSSIYWRVVKDFGIKTSMCTGHSYQTGTCKNCIIDQRFLTWNHSNEQCFWLPC